MIKNQYDYDVCIVGSGPAGGFTAHELAKSGIKVAVIEAGGKSLDVRTDNTIDEEASNINTNINFGFSQQLGGTSNLWSGGLARFYPIDLIERKKFGFEGWPISMNSLELLYKRVNKIIGITDPKQDQEKLEKELKYLENSTYMEARDMNILNEPFSIRNLIENSKGVKIFTKCTVKKFNINNNKISSLEVFDLDKNFFFNVVAKKYILAAGAITNIRLMLYSLDKYKHKFSDLYNNIGLYFSTHPKANIGYIKLYKPLSPNHPFLSYKRHINYTTRLQFGLNEKMLLQHELLNHCIRINTTFNTKFNKFFDMIKLFFGRSYLFNSGESYMSEIVAKLGVLIYRFINQINFSKSKSNILTLRIFMDQSASKYNRVKLSDKISKSGLPLASINWNFNNDDWMNVEKFISIFANEIKSLGIGELIYKKPSGKDFIGIHSHFMGGTRCGNDKSKSVTDNDLKVHDFDNLYISGPSVFPSFGYTNPFYTIAALSLRLADHLTLSLKHK